MKFFIGFIKLVCILLIVYLLSAFFANSSYRVERTRFVTAPQKLIYNQIGILRNWENWSPWQEKDSTLQNTYSGKDGEIGSVMNWIGNKELSGTGAIEIVHVNPPYSMLYKLSFIVPFEMSSKGLFTLSSDQSDQTNIIWVASGDIPFLMRPMMMFIDMDQHMGSDFERGLYKMDSICTHFQRQIQIIIHQDSLNNPLLN